MPTVKMPKAYAATTSLHIYNHYANLLTLAIRASSQYYANE